MLRSRHVLSVLLAACAATSLPAQVRPAPRPPAAAPRRGFDSTGVGDTSMFAPLGLPPGTIYRSGSGAPGPEYWQQRADYDLQATLDTAAKTLHGLDDAAYTNNSPDTLRFIWMQMEQNAFKATAR